MKRIINIMIAVAAALTSLSCNGAGSKAAETNASAPQPTDKALVVYFSHAGDNYAVGNIEVGNTKIIADYISDITGADQFEVVAEKSYDMPYSPLTELAREEQSKGEKPAFKGKIDNIDQYKVIFIGTPIWWGTYPQVMFTFFDAYDLNGKTLIPFATHEGSGMGRTVSDLSTAFPGATILDGIAIYGHDARTAKPTVEAWLKKLGY